jgi:hypothetical protein
MGLCHECHREEVNARFATSSWMWNAMSGKKQMVKNTTRNVLLGEMANRCQRNEL